MNEVNNNIQPEDNKKKVTNMANAIIVFLIIIILSLVAIIAMVLNNNKNTKKTNKETTKEVTKKEETNKEEQKKYTSAELAATGDKFYKLQIVDGELKATMDDKAIKITGINSKVKSFTYGHDCGGYIEVLVLDINNKVYVFGYEADDFNSNSVLAFKQINTNEEIVDITKHPETGYTTCGEPYLAVVLKNKEVRAVYKDEQNNYKIGTFDYSVVVDDFEVYFVPLVLYKDKTISKYYADTSYDGYYKYNAKVNEKLKYDNKELAVDKYIYVETKSGRDKSLSYIISNKKLYKLEATTYGFEIKSINLTLVNENDIKSESLKIKKGMNIYGYEDTTQKTDVITFTDGSSIKIINIESAYSF